MLKRVELLKKRATKFPKTSGIYRFYDSKKTVIYVGKSKNLKNRVLSYFTLKTFGKTDRMVREAGSVDYIKTNTDFEAIFLEADLVRKYLPKYNAQLRDDKSALYVGITGELLPRVLLLRKTQIKALKLKQIYGPYLSSTEVRKILGVLRKSFAYSTHKGSGRVCLNNQIGLCNPCPSEILKANSKATKTVLKKQYLRNVRSLQKILEGKLPSVRKRLVREMNSYSKREDFEEARNILHKLISLDKMVSKPNLADAGSYLENPNFAADLRKIELDGLGNLLDKYFNLSRLTRIECFDIAHLSGTFPTASMVVAIEGEMDTGLYRHFNVEGISDTDSMKEVIKRRMEHLNDWGRPDLIMVDGGKPQVSAVLESVGDIAVIGLAKRWERLVVRVNGKFEEIEPPEEVLMLLQRLRDESHRFARRLHHTRISRSVNKWQRS